MNKTNVVIVGAGPGGLTAGMLLAHRGFQVSIFEKAGNVGGRNATLRLGPYIFDTGPTFLMMKFILDEMFTEVKRNSADYLAFRKLEPMYRLSFRGRTLAPVNDPEKAAAEIGKLFPDDAAGYGRYVARERDRFRRLYPCLQKPYSRLGDYLHPDLFKAIPHLALGKSLHANLGRYFTEEDLKLCFTFQAKYLGMSPWDCPGLFTIISYIENAYGIYHVMGGLSEISEAMAKVIGEEGGQIHLNSPVRRVVVENGSATGVELMNGEKVAADDVIINADFAHSMTHLVDPAHLRRFRRERIDAMDYSCSIFMIYLGIDKQYDEPHHHILFADDYRANVDDMTKRKVISEDMSVYVRNAAVTDDRTAPQGHSALYILVPVPNNTSGIDWDREKQAFRDKVIRQIMKKTSMKDLDQHIQAEKIITPTDWETDYAVKFGAVFNLAHNWSQLLYFRPHNKFEDFDHCYLVGGGTHPGSGLPTIYESARISSNLISKRYGKHFPKPLPLPEAP